MEPLGRTYAVRGLPAGDRRFPESLQMDGGNVPVGRVSVWVWTWRCHRSYCSTPLRIVPLLLLTNDYCETTIATIDIYHCHNHNDTKDHNHCCCCSSYQTPATTTATTANVQNQVTSNLLPDIHLSSLTETDNYDDNDGGDENDDDSSGDKVRRLLLLPLLLVRLLLLLVL